MNLSAHKTTLQKRAFSCVFCWPTSTGKEKDEETGYGYFGARYMDHELMTMWLSVDPMANMYPAFSPYNYCRWNPIKRIDVAGLFDTEKQAQKAQERAMKRFGADRVGDIFNNGTCEKPNYSFHIYGEGKDNKTHGDSRENGVWAYHPDATVSSKMELFKYTYFKAERENKLTMTLSLGLQGRINMGDAGVNVNLNSIDLAEINLNLDDGNINNYQAKENNARASSGMGLSIGVAKIEYKCRYRGGDYIDKNSIVHSVKGNVLGAGVGTSAGNIEFGIGGALFLGVDIRLSSTIRK